MNNYFDSQHPIVLASMNRVSTLPLALACWDAGVFPSLMIPFQQQDFQTPMSHEDRRDAVNQVLLEFRKITGNCNVVLGLSYSELDDSATMKLILDHQVSHVELFSIVDQTRFYNPMRDKYQKLYETWLEKKINVYSSIRFMQRCRLANNLPSGTAICLHGSDGAGGTNAELTTKQMFDLQRELTPDAVVIPYGGIGTPQQVSYYLNAGAVAVAVGTLFAACAESPLSESTKHAMVLAGAASVVRTPDSNQNMLPLGTLAHIVDSKSQSGANRDVSLHAGIYGNGHIGHIYAGHGIQHVDGIRTAKQTVAYLMQHTYSP